jgi:hypothetical protein
MNVAEVATSYPKNFESSWKATNFLDLCFTFFNQPLSSTAVESAENSDKQLAQNCFMQPPRDQKASKQKMLESEVYHFESESRSLNGS